MKKLILTSGAFLILLFTLKGQTKQSEVVASAGNSASIGANTIEWTLGEVIVGTVSSSTTTLTQGFHQSFVLKVETSIDIPNVEVSVFPNPTAEFLQVSTNSLSEVEIYLFNLQGHFIEKTIPNSEQTTIDMSRYSEGIYMLKVLHKPSGQHELIKIIKN